MSSKYEIVEPDRNFRGKSYCDWVVEWSNWLHSGDPDRTAVRGDIVFLRGNIDYYRFTANLDPKVKDVDLFYNRTGKNSLLIAERTAILVPILTSTRSIGETFNGNTLMDEEQIRRAAREDNDSSGGIYLRISVIAPGDKASEFESIAKSVAGKEATDAIDLVKDYRIESPVFTLRISESNPFLKSLNTVYNISPGESPAVTDGFFVILHKLKAGVSYRLQFGGRGSSGSAYLTDSLYDIHVVESMSSKLKDISNGTSNANIAIVTDNDKGIPDRTKAIAPLQLL